MGLIRGLPWNVEEIVAEIAAQDGSDFLTVLLEAVTAMRDRGSIRPSCGAVTIPLGADIEAMAEPGRLGAPPQWWIGNEHLRITFDCAGYAPTAAEADAIERIHEAAGEAVALFRSAFRPSPPTEPTWREVTLMTGMDPGPSGPGLPVPDDTVPADPDQSSAEPE